MLKLFTAFIFAFTVMAFPARAAETLQTKGNLASFYSQVTVGCITSHRFLLASEESYRNDSTSDARRTLYVTEYDHDHCLGVEVRSATGFKDLARYELASGAGTSRLMTSIEMNGTSGSELRNVDLTWSATEKTWSGTFTNHYSGPGYLIVTRSTGSTRSAVVSGTFGNQAVNTSGSLDIVKTGSVSITKK